MMFVTLQDMSAQAELLVFPKKYEETQTLWEVGKVVCIIGKTPREEGDNKIFVENVYELTPETVDQVVGMVSIANRVITGDDSRAVRESMKSQKTVSISVTKEALSACAPELKQCFLDHPGEYLVYLKIGDKQIETSSRIAVDGPVIDILEAMFGEHAVQVRH